MTHLDLIRQKILYNVHSAHVCLKRFVVDLRTACDDDVLQEINWMRIASQLARKPLGTRETAVMRMVCVAVTQTHLTWLQ